MGEVARAYRRDTGVEIGPRHAVDYSSHRCDDCQEKWFEPVRAGDGTFDDAPQVIHDYYLTERSEYAPHPRAGGRRRSGSGSRCG